METLTDRKLAQEQKKTFEVQEAAQGYAALQVAQVIGEKGAATRS